jgi:hypothetical protein
MYTPNGFYPQRKNQHIQSYVSDLVAPFPDLSQKELSYREMKAAPKTEGW